MTGDIYQSMALVTIFTMVFIAVLGAIRTARDQSIPIEASVRLIPSATAERKSRLMESIR